MCFLLETSAKLGDDVRFLDEDDFFTLEFHLGATVLPVHHAVPDLQLHRDQRILLTTSGTYCDHLALDRLFLGRVGDVETALHRLRLLHRPNGHPIRKREDLQLCLRSRCGCHGAQSSTSLPGSKCLWNNVVSTLGWRVLINRRGISPAGDGMSRGRCLTSESRVSRERVHDRSGPVRCLGPKGIEGRRNGGHDRPGARVGQAHVKPGQGRWLRFLERERQEVRGGPAPAPHVPPHREAPTPEPLRDTLAEGIAARDEDLVASQGRGLLVTGGRGTSENDIRRYDATLYETQGSHGSTYNVPS